MSYHARRGQPKGFSDMRDLALLLLTFPELKIESGLVSEALRQFGANEDIIAEWRNLVKEDIKAPSEEDEFDY
jgi:hypothetical protein